MNADTARDARRHVTTRSVANPSQASPSSSAVPRSTGAGGVSARPSRQRTAGAPWPSSITAVPAWRITSRPVSASPSASCIVARVSNSTTAGVSVPTWRATSSQECARSSATASGCSGSATASCSVAASQTSSSWRPPWSVGVSPGPVSVAVASSTSRSVAIPSLAARTSSASAADSPTAKESSRAPGSGSPTGSSRTTTGSASAASTSVASSVQADSAIPAPSTTSTDLTAPPADRHGLVSEPLAPTSRLPGQRCPTGADAFRR